MVDDALAVDTLRNRLADFHITEWFKGAGHCQVHDVGIRYRQELQAIIALNGLVIIRAEFHDVVNCTRLQLQEASCAFSSPAEDQSLGLSRFAPVVIKAFEDKAVATVPAFQVVRTGADRFFKQFTSPAGFLNPFTRLDVEGCKRDLSHEGRVGFAHLDFNSEFI